ncbi:phosphoribosyltransferase [Helicobacter kayseriensis]|uniref:phosphoribosyltransferase n=1 Tax=Helicobacter kayseriensis TaxID=2905877 RepID=UPI001E2DECA0|nr:phosphoribosyltransferase family protein [Helicobacter kayseriensis]MCE3047155.1 phosphoribosyltransferase [Helicobacter kayseriensis]MCE3048526.1 phosphoribosyltransferase [Helicobacter kayseriensis]
MQYYPYDEFLKDARTLFEKIDSQIGKPDAIIAIARGGLTLAHMLSLRWNLREVYSLNAISYDGNKQQELIIKNVPNINKDFKKVLIVDEIVDSGKSLHKIMEILREENADIKFYSAVVFQKQNAQIKADFFIREPQDWIDFFWERDMF